MLKHQEAIAEIVALMTDEENLNMTQERARQLLPKLEAGEEIPKEHLGSIYACLEIYLEGIEELTEIEAELWTQVCEFQGLQP